MLTSRNQSFQPDRQPLENETNWQLDRNQVSGPIAFLNPTNARFRHNARDDVHFEWTSRNNRKGRHAILVRSNTAAAHTLHPTWTLISRNIWRILTNYPIWDVSFDVAFLFTIGSIIWVINGFFEWFPTAFPETQFNRESLYGGGLTAFIGATVFEIGSLLLLLEAINECQTGCFGWAIENAIACGRNSGTAVLRPMKADCTHHHLNKQNLVGRGNRQPSQPPSKQTQDGRSWTWWPSAYDLRTHHFRSLGFLASLSQLIGASIFWVAGLTSLPGIYDNLSRPLALVFYWTTQIVGGTGFIISGTLFMIETQSKWWKPSPMRLGWWVGAWNLVGGIGFTISPAFGIDEASWVQYQVGLSTFWGSWAFLLGSMLQWYESLEKFPVEVEE